MIRPNRLRAVITLLTILGAVGLPPVVSAEEIAVVVQETAIRSEPKFFAPSRAVARFTDRLQLLEGSGGWYKVRYKGTTGWVHQSAVSAGAGKGEGSSTLSGLGKALGVLSGDTSAMGSSSEGYSEDEVALAGKGFNADVERNYRGRYPQAQFGAVDRLQRQQAGSKELASFIKAGALGGPAPVAAPTDVEPVRSEERPTATAGREPPTAPQQEEKEEGDGLGGLLKGIGDGAKDFFKGSGERKPEVSPWDL